MAEYIGYLQHGNLDTAMRTERVELIQHDVDVWYAKYEGRWYKVRYSRENWYYIQYRGIKIRLLIEGA